MARSRTLLYALLVLLGGALLLGLMASRGVYLSSLTAHLQDNLAAVFFIPSITTAELRQKYDDGKIKILLVPGHEPTQGGTEFGVVKERNLTLALAEQLAAELEQSSRFEVVLARDKNGWHPDLQNFFSTRWADILAYRSSTKAEMQRLISTGEIYQVTDGVGHGTAPSDIGTRLFGLTMWADDTDVDISVHIHFNDYAGRNNNIPGVYTGFSIYVPEAQYSNAQATRDLAEHIYDELQKEFSVSTLPKEDEGIIDDQELIAIGANNAIDGVSLLIEYGYIYEPHIALLAGRADTFETMAERTAAGIKNYLAGK